MHTHRHWLWPAIGSATVLAVASVSAAGLGSGASTAVLGQPLDFAVQVRLEPGDTLVAECVTAEVTAGDRRLPPATVRTVLEMTGPETARVRVQTQSAMDEPVIGIQLSVGCSARMTRRYVVLADPPQIAAVAAAVAVAAAPSFAANPVLVSDALSAPPATAAATAATAATAVQTSPDAGSARLPVPPAASGGNTAALDTTAQPPRARAERRAVTTPPAARPRASRRDAVLVAAKAPAAKADTPARLMLEPAETSRSTETAAVDEALAAVAQAASAARAAASAASASAERMATLERTVEQLRTEAKTSRDLAAQFKQRLSGTEGASIWMLPLMVVAGLLAALAAWLAWRLGRVQTARQQGWRDASVAAAAVVPTQDMAPSRQPTAPIPFVTSELQRPVAQPANRVRTAPAWPPPAPPVDWPPPDSTVEPEPPEASAHPDFEPDLAMQRTVPLAPSALPNSMSGALSGAMPDDGAPRDVSIEELIDLEQQAEFFVVLGQDDAAIDLLTEHLRTTGGGSPLPYLKLLEIHHRRDEREAYERIRSRFNHRFNAYAPEWGVDLGHGRSLDDYSGVIPRLQQVWARPLDAMAELEALLFRKSRGELFDLPAYREVLFLYSLARDLMDRASADTGNVDLLLPMADGGEFSSTAPAPFLGLDRDAFRDTMPPDDRPTGPVDFDVSAAERPTSIFDLLDEKTQPLRRP